MCRRVTHHPTHSTQRDPLTPHHCSFYAEYISRFAALLFVPNLDDHPPYKRRLLTRHRCALCAFRATMCLATALLRAFRPTQRRALTLHNYRLYAEYISRFAALLPTSNTRHRFHLIFSTRNLTPIAAPHTPKALPIYGTSQRQSLPSLRHPRTPLAHPIYGTRHSSTAAPRSPH